MTEVLLEELIDSDIEWMIATGRKQRVSANELLIGQNAVGSAFYIVLEGTLSATIINDPKSALGRAFSALADEQTSKQEVLRFSAGDVLGETSFLNKSNSSVAVQTVEDSLVLVLPYDQIHARLDQDLEFASRFYRAIAILLYKRFERLLQTFTHRKGMQIAPLQDGPLLFGELSDRDVDWMIEHASVEKVGADRVLIQAGRLVEKLYIVLQGLLSLSIVDSKQSTITNIFDRLQTSSEATGREIARVSMGEIVGETALLNVRMSNFTAKTLEPAIFLALPRQQMALKLQQDPAMGARFYRVLSILLSGRLEGLISRLGYGHKPYRIGQTLSQNVQYEDEIDDELIDGVTLGGARFDWMLRRLNVKGA